MKAFLLAILVALGSTQALSSTPAGAMTDQQFEAYFKSLAVNRINRVLANGWTHVGNREIRLLLEDLQKPRVALNPANFTTTTDDRAVAMWQSPRNTIFVNKRAWDALADDIKPGIAIHELMGAMGLDDHNYQISFRLELMEQMPYRPSTFLESRFQIAGRGGATGVGGGGDGDQYLMKREIFSMMRRIWSRNATTQARHDMMKRFENHYLELGFHFFMYQRANEGLSFRLDHHRIEIQVGMNQLPQLIRNGAFEAYVCAAVSNLDEDAERNGEFPAARNGRELLARASDRLALCH